MNLLCAPKGIIDIKKPYKGFCNIVEGGYKDILLDFSLSCLTWELECIGKENNDAEKENEPKVFENPEKMNEIMMPLVKQTAQMGLGNRLGVILLYVVFYMPMNVLLYSGYLTNIPIALEEAAFVDGATTWTTYWKVIFPIMKPMHATVAILTALGTWNDVMTPLVIMSGSKNTLPLAQLSFQTQFGANYNLAFASYLLALLPIILFYLICQKQILSGVVNGAVK